MKSPDGESETRDGRPGGPTGQVRHRRHLMTFLVLLVIGGCLLAFDPALEELYDRLGDGNSVLNHLALRLTWAVNPVSLGALTLLFLLFPRSRRTGVCLATALLLQAVVIEALKEGTGRLRPVTTEQLFGIAATVFLGPFSGGESFPSGHAGAAFALATVLAAAYPRWRWFLFGLAACVGIARVQLDRHFFGDVYFGGVIGYYVAQATVALLMPRGYGA